MKHTVLVSKLDHPIHDGDWHDKPMHYRVDGPARESTIPGFIGPVWETQNFCTKREAKHYAAIRRRTATQQEAGRLWLDSELAR